MNGKRIRILPILLCAVCCLCGCAGGKTDDRVRVVATNFPAYDFSRAAAGDCADVSMLLDPGVEIHSYDPSPEDIRKIETADLFVYTGGESDTWVEKVLSSLNGEKPSVIKMTDHSTLLTEDGSDETDEHVWMSPENAARIVKAIAGALAENDAAHAGQYTAQATAYCEEIEELAKKTKETVQRADSHTLIVADRFPLKYFCHSFGLSYVAAFDACDLLADADAATVVKLIRAVKETGCRGVFYIENGSGFTADTVCRETDAEKIKIHSMHSVSKDELRSGLTYLEVMENNRKALERGLAVCR